MGPLSFTTTSRAPGVYLLDDQRMLRAALGRVLRDLGRFEIVGETGDFARALREIRACRPDVVVVDLTRDLITSGEAVQLVRCCAPGAAIVLVVELAQACATHRALARGARACLSRYDEPIELVLAVDAAHRGVQFVSPRFATCTCGRAEPADRSSPRVPPPTA